MKLIKHLAKKLRRKISPFLKPYRNWRKLENQSPTVLKVELTNICNANCVFCGYQYEERTKGFMPDELYQQAVQEFAALGGNKLSYIPIVGEPLLDKQLAARTRKAKEWGMKQIYTYSNGILLYKYDLEGLLKSGLTQLFISTAPFDAESFDRLYRHKSYNDLMNGIEKLLITNRDLGEPVDIHFLIRSDVPREEVFAKPDYQKRIRPHINEQTDIGVMVKGYDSWGGMIKPEDLPGEMELAEIPQDKSRPCDQTFSMTVLWDGRVRACGCRFNNDEQDPLIIGDIKEQPLAEIWNGEKLKQVRRNFVNGTLPDLCRKCTTYNPI